MLSPDSSTLYYYTSTGRRCKAQHEFLARCLHVNFTKARALATFGRRSARSQRKDPYSQRCRRTVLQKAATFGTSHTANVRRPLRYTTPASANPSANPSVSILSVFHFSQENRNGSCTLTLGQVHLVLDVLRGRRCATGSGDKGKIKNYRHRRSSNDGLTACADEGFGASAWRVPCQPRQSKG